MPPARQGIQGVLQGNPVAVQALGLCPALAVTTTLTHAMGMAAATLAVLVASCLLASLLRRLTRGPLQLASCIVLITTLVTVVELLTWAWLPRLAQGLGPFLPLVVVNCLILGRVIGYASKKPPLSSTVDALGHGIGFALVLLSIALIRELFGQGTLTVGGENLWPEARIVDWGPLSLTFQQGKILTPLSRGTPLRLLQLPAGALLLLAYLSGVIQHHLARRRIKHLRGTRR